MINQIANTYRETMSGKMSARLIPLLFILLGLLFSGTFSKGSASEDRNQSDKSTVHKHRRDVITPMTTTPMTNPVINPYTTPMTNPATNPYTNPNLGDPTAPSSSSSSSGQSWCIASPSASETALQVALDYACGYGGADCSEIQQAGSCFNPDTVRDHASYAFNSYYQKNPVTTSCDFGGTAMITNTDPSTSACQYPSSSTSSSTLNTTIPTGSTVFGSSPPDYTNSKSGLIRKPTSFTVLCLLIWLKYLKVYK